MADRQLKMSDASKRCLEAVSGHNELRDDYPVNSSS